METIKEKIQKASSDAAKEWVPSTMETGFERIDPVRQGCFIEGAKWMHAELTRWNDPDESRPENLQRVLVKYRQTNGSTKVGIATFHRLLGIGRGAFVMGASRPQYIIGWREIHE